MKKLTALALTAVMTFGAAGMSAQAAGRLNGITEDLSNKDEIHILYNDKVVEYEDVKPVNTDGRVMIPFRAALENMGATVDYDDAARQVTAKKGDITIKFTLMDDTIYIDENGKASTITMDVPMIIVSDRTLVPIRFMSNAFGMQVGWDGNTETVVIMDYEDYSDELKSIMPNLTKLSEISTPDFNKFSDTIGMKLDYADGQKAVSLNMDMTSEAEVSGDTVGVKAALSLDNGQLKIDNADTQLIINDGNIYANVKDVPLINSDNWYKIDIKKLINSLDVPEETKQLLLLAMTSPSDAQDIFANIFGDIDMSKDADFENVMQIAAAMDMYESMDKYISVTSKDNGGYSTSINITNDDFAKIVSDTYSAVMTADAIKKITDAMQLNVSAKADCDGSKQTSEGSVNFALDDSGNKISFDLKISETSETAAEVNVASVPENSIDITDMLLK